MPTQKTEARRLNRERSERAAEAATAQSPSMILIVMLGVLGILAYGSFLLNPANRGDLLPYVLVIGAETVLAGSALLSMWTILAGSQDPRDYTYNQARERLFEAGEADSGELTGRPASWPLRLRGRVATVDVFVTTYGEPLHVLHRTVSAAMAMHGRHVTWVLDDGGSDEVANLARQLGAGYIRREDRTGAKAGNVNNALAATRGEFFVIFDADFVPRPRFLIETMPFFARKAVAFVQTPQTYGNLRTFIARGAGYMQTVFYRLIQPGRNRFNAAFCVGTNVVFRRSAIEQIGGMYTASKSEDVWTSLLLHEAGWRSVFLPVTLAVGDAPETIAAWSKQQLRWATGAFEILLQRNPLGRKRRLTLDQRLQYLVTATHYLTGIAPGVLLLVPPLEIYLDLRPMNLTITPTTWLLYYAGFYLLQIGLAFYAVGSFRWETLLLSSVAFPIYLKALTNVLRGRQTAWSATGARGTPSSPFNYIVPQTLLFLFLSLTSVVGVWRDLDNGVATLATAWNVTNSLILGAFMGAALRESHGLRVAARAARRAPLAVPRPIAVAASRGNDRLVDAA